MLLGILRLPFRVIRLPLSLVLVVIGIKHRRRFHLPAAGLDETKAQSILFALRRAATTPEEGRVAAEWLAALQVVQVASGLLLHELDGIEANLEFWTNRLEAGRHFWFTLLQRGPIAFFHRVGELLRRRDAQAEPRDRITDAELVEKRVLIFRLLRGALCEALAGVQHAGSMLYLQQGMPAEVESGGADAPGASAETEVESLFCRAEESIQGSMAAVAEAYAQLRRSTLTTLESQQAPAGAAARDRPMLRQALSRVLGVSRIRRIFTQPGAPGGEPPAAGGAQLEPWSPVDSGGATAAAAVAARAATFEAAQRAVGFAAVLPPDATVHTVLAAARLASARHPGLVVLPKWVQMPTQAQQYWLRYTIVGVAVGYGAVFVIRHSRLVGSRDLEDWAAAGAGAARAAWAEHVIGPLERVRGELFNTFRRRPAIVSMGEYEADRDSLQRMLDDFSKDYVKRRGAGAAARVTPPQNNAGSSSAGNSSSAAAAAAAAAAGTAVSGVAGGGGGAPAPAGDPDVELLQGMELMMQSYEQELKKPIRNLVSGDLARSLLIQVQKLKVDTESAMLEIDQILRANELSISLVAAVPAFLIAGAALYGLGRVLTPAPPDPRREAVPARVAMIEVERALETAAAPAGAAQAEAEGMFVYRLAVAFSEAEGLFRRHRGLFRSAGAAEWPNLRADLLELAAPAPAEQKLRTAARMMRVYAVYQQF